MQCFLPAKAKQLSVETMLSSAETALSITKTMLSKAEATLSSNKIA